MAVKMWYIYFTMHNIIPVVLMSPSVCTACSEVGRICPSVQKRMENLHYDMISMCMAVTALVKSSPQTPNVTNSSPCSLSSFTCSGLMSFLSGETGSIVS